MDSKFIANLYSAIDNQITHFHLNLINGQLTKKLTVQVSEKVQYAWFHPTLKLLYISTSNGGPRVLSDSNYLSVFKIHADGSIEAIGLKNDLPNRAVHLSINQVGNYVINAHNFPSSSVSIHSLDSNGNIKGSIIQNSNIDLGIYPHQVMCFPLTTSILIVDRGFNPQNGQNERPGALRTFAFNDGQLISKQVIAPNEGFGFGPRHIDFHPSNSWIYVSDERFNRLYMFKYNLDTIELTPSYDLSSLANPNCIQPRQLGGPIHVHPNGRFVYMINRADATKEFISKQVFIGGENNIAVFNIDSMTGKPTLIDHVPTNAFHVRTFSLDPTGNYLICGSIKKINVLTDNNIVEETPACLSVFKISENGTPKFIESYDVDTSDKKLQYWIGFSPWLS